MKTALVLGAMLPFLLLSFGGGMLFARFLIVRKPEQVGLRHTRMTNSLGESNSPGSKMTKER
jgi:hypothetical protein